MTDSKVCPVEDMLDDLRECCSVELSGQQMTDLQDYKDVEFRLSNIKKMANAFSDVGSFLKKKKRCTSALIQP